jgi:hypothetical protein
MQEINVILSSLHELEFLFAYNKHILTVNQCKCDNAVCNLKEFYRVYLNMKNLSIFLRKEVSKLHNENIKLRKHNTNLTNRLNTVLRHSSAEGVYSVRASNQNIYDDLGKKFFKLDRLDSLIDTNTTTLPTPNSTYKKNESPKMKKFCSQQNVNKIPVTEKGALGSYASELALHDSAEIHLLKATPRITTIGKTIEETESKLAIRRTVNSFQGTAKRQTQSKQISFVLSPERKNTGAFSSASSFSSSGYSSQKLLDQANSRQQCPKAKRNLSVDVCSPSLNHSPVSYTTSPSSVSTHTHNRVSHIRCHRPVAHNSFSNLNYEFSSVNRDSFSPIYSNQVLT